MLRTWILVADGSHARIFLSLGLTKPLSLVRELEHPEARAKGEELFTDKPRMEPGMLPKDHEGLLFARELADVLDKACSRNEYDQLVLVSPPSFLGPLRKQLHKQVQVRVIDELAKDLVSLSPKELEARLGPR